MDLIYSRPRIKLPKFRFNGYRRDPNKTYKNISKLIQIILIVSIAFTILISSINAMYPIFEEQCISRTKSIMTIVLNEKATEVMSNYRYIDLITTYTDELGNVNMIKANVIPINEIISAVPVQIQNTLNKDEYANFTIPLGSVLGSRLLSR